MGLTLHFILVAIPYLRVHVSCKFISYTSVTVMMFDLLFWSTAYKWHVVVVKDSIKLLVNEHLL